MTNKHIEALYSDGDAQNQPSLLKSILWLLVKIMIIIGIFILIFTFIYGIYQVKDLSMTPAFQEGDIVIFYRINEELAVESVVLLSYQGERQLRRVIAVAGDTVDINSDGLLINGALWQGKVEGQNTQAYEEGVTFPLTVAEGEVFVLADMRENATDSRIYGTIQIKDCEGSVFTLIRRRGF